jgi:hypothetical protein
MPTQNQHKSVSDPLAPSDKVASSGLFNFSTETPKDKRMRTCYSDDNKNVTKRGLPLDESQ